MRSFLYNQTVRFAVCALMLILLISPFLETPPELAEAAPTGVYASATVSNPSSALTDFSLMIDLSDMPAAWWSAVDTSDGTKGRAYKDDLATELATDWIDFDNGAETGWLRVKWSGTLASSGTQTIRIYPPNTSNSSYAAGATYGQYNAYDSSWVGYWPDGGGEDRTSNQYNMTASGGPTIGGATGQVGGGTDLDGTDDYSFVSGPQSDLDSATTATLIGWGYREDAGHLVAFGFPRVASASNDRRFDILWFSNDRGYSQVSNGSSSFPNYALAGTGWHHFALSYDGSQSGLSRVATYNDGAAQSLAAGGVDPAAALATAANLNNFEIGRDSITNNPRYTNGIIDDVSLHSTNRSAAWIAHEYSQTNNQSSFWGTWTASDTTDPSISFTAATPFDGASQSSTSLVTGLTTSDTSDHYAFLDLDDSLLAWWRAEANGNDDSGNSHTVTLNGDTTYVDGNWGQALSFDGDADYAEASSTGLGLGPSDSVSISAWFYDTEGSDTFPRIVDVFNSSAGGYYMFKGQYGVGTNKQISCGIEDESHANDVASYFSTATYSANTWNHAVCVYNGSSWTLYLNDTAHSPDLTNSAGIGNTTNVIRIGSRDDNARDWEGYIDDVAIFSRALSVAEVSSLYDSGSNQYSQTHAGLSEGDHTITGYAVDSAGNTANTGESTITIDATDPTISFTATTPADGSSQDSTSLVTGLTTADAASSHYAFLNLNDSLVGWWRGEGNANDESGNGNTGTLVNNTTYVPGKFGRTFSFDGVDDFVALGTSPVSGLPLTISAWVQLDTYNNANNYAVSLGNNADNPNNISLGTDNSGAWNGVFWGSSFNRISQAGGALGDVGSWVHLAATYADNGGGSVTFKFYIDGAVIGEQTVSDSVNAFNDLVIGGRVNRRDDWNGQVDDVLVFDRVLSDEEIASLYDASADQYSVTHTSLSEGDHTIQGYTVDGAGNTANTSERTITVDTTDPTISYSGDTPSDSSEQNSQSIDVDLTTADDNGSHYSFLNLDDSLVGWWRGESNATDESGNGNNGTLQGDATYTSGQFGEAFEFDGTGDYVSVSDIDPTNQVSASLWFKTSDTSQQQIILAQGNEVIEAQLQMTGTAISGRPFRVRIDTAGGNSIVDSVSSGAISLDTWTHVAFTYDGTTTTIYVNGSSEAINTDGSGNIDDNDLTWKVGSNSNATLDTLGQIDDILIFSRALTSDEVASLYDSQATQYSATHSSLSEGDHTLQAYTVDSAGNTASESERTVTIDITAPVISEVTPVTTPTTDNTPDYTFTTDEAGDITYGGSCTSATTSASSGSNTITFSTLSDGTYSDCTITVQDSAGNDSNTITATTFVVDAGSPTPGSSGAITTANITTSGADLSWTKATDTVTAQSSLEYLVYTSSQDNISTVALAEANGDAQGSYTADIDSLSLTGLTSSTTYYVNVLVKDENDNKAEYTSTSFTTSSPSSGAAGSVAKAAKKVVETVREIIPDSFFNPVKPVANVIDSITDLFGGGEEEESVEPITVPEEAPLAFRGNLFLPDRIVGNFVFSPLPDSFLALQQKFPEIGETFSDVGVTTVADVPRLAGLEFNIPRLGDVIERGLGGDLGDIAIEEGRLPGGDISSNSLASVIGIPVSELPARVIDTIPTDVVFARSADEKVDIGSELAIDANGDVNQVLEVISGQQLKLLVKPGEEVESITGFLTIDNRELAEAEEERSGVDLGSMVASAFLANPKLAKETNREVEREFVLETFAYNDEDEDGVYEANVNMPLVKGQYAIKTRIVPADSNRPIREIEMITVIDPEGYIYEKIGNQELRLNDATVSIWWKNGETGEFELWPAEEFQQVNPQVTDKSGEYSFLVPEGEYYLTVEVDGYEKFESDIFKVSFGRPVHMNIEMKSDSFLKKVWRFITNIF